LFSDQLLTIDNYGCQFSTSLINSSEKTNIENGVRLNDSDIEYIALSCLCRDKIVSFILDGEDLTVIYRDISTPEPVSGGVDVVQGKLARTWVLDLYICNMEIQTQAYLCTLYVNQGYITTCVA
jgi:hypothetical protein